MQNSQILFYQTEAGQTKIEVRLQDETVWLTQKLMAELFQKDVRTINEHIKNIYQEGELHPDPTIRKFRIVQKEGQREIERLVEFYNLVFITPVKFPMNWLSQRRKRSMKSIISGELKKRILQIAILMKR